MSEKRPTHEHAEKDGSFQRKPSQFRNYISKDPSSDFPAEADRYALYINYGCPWAHRTILVRALKGLEDIIQLIATDFDLTKDGWIFTGKNDSDPVDPLYGFTGLKQLYLKADPEYTGRFLVPCLWDKKKHTIVNNESSEIIRMFYTEFDHLIPNELRESSRPSSGFYPLHSKDEIDAMNEWVYNTINNGVYKVGFATTQSAYDANIYPLFESLDRLEVHLANGNPANHGGPFLFGAHLTEADIRLYPTIIRFDVAYHTIFLCNRKTIRHDYPNLYTWLRLCYWRGGAAFSTDSVDRTTVFKDMSNFTAYRYGYTRARQRMLSKGDDSVEIVVPAGPAVEIDPIDDRAVEEDAGAVAAKIERLKLQGEGRDTVAAVFANESDDKAVDETGQVKENGENSQLKLDQVPSGVNPHDEENQKWYKAAEKAEKKAGVQNVHLAQS